jgi:phosphocarrier protein
MVEVIVEVTNKKGLHARAAAKFVKVAASYNAQAQVMKHGENGEGDSPAVAASSILGLMMLGADPGSKLHISADGAQAQEMIAALKELVESKFGEGE